MGNFISLHQGDKLSSSLSLVVVPFDILYSCHVVSGTHFVASISYVATQKKIGLNNSKPNISRYIVIVGFENVMKQKHVQTLLCLMLYYVQWLLVLLSGGGIGVDVGVGVSLFLQVIDILLCSRYSCWSVKLILD